MKTTSRRKMLLRAAAAGGAVAGFGAVSRRGAPAAEAQGRGRGHDHDTVDGPLASATVSFGQWPTDPPFDRNPNVLPTPAQNVHLVTPFETTIKAGGAVNFIIAGLHQIQIYEPGTTPEHIRAILGPVGTPPPAGTTVAMVNPPGLPLINIAAGRVYRGPDPSFFGLDRTESVQLTQPGRYLVICGFLFHFDDNMYGYVRVLR